MALIFLGSLQNFTSLTLHMCMRRTGYEVEEDYVSATRKNEHIWFKKNPKHQKNQPNKKEQLL